ncbi:hypothetical protein H072_24 [Dactylellina haptotyla CBS 200.50]|uniref:UVI-1 protein n=1 Tax=Dactylellina haptotyla (strain CBS 200.50) TaxID=1284197 RepID=S8CE84_DACHA|nr:hypothetical protein H072_24 [Dactylellina haptotyla CBS 200.50]
MHLFKVAFTAALAILAAPSFAAVTPTQVVSNIKILTSKSKALQGPAQSISLINGPLIVIGLGPFPPIIAGFTEIITLVTADIAAMSGTAPITGAVDAKNIADAFREFVQVHQKMLNILIGKAGLFNTVPIIGEPVAGVLRSLEKIVDTIAFGLIDLVESQAVQMTMDKESLGGTITLAIDSYDGLNLKSKQRRHSKDIRIV